MDKLSEIPRQTLLGALAAGRQHGLDADILPVIDAPGGQKDGHPDARIRVRHDGHQCDYTVEVTSTLPAPAWHAVLHQVSRMQTPVMVVGDYIPPAFAALLRANKIPFLDTAGNAFIQQNNLLISVEGRKRVSPARKTVVGRAFQPTGLQVIFTLLCLPEAVNQPYRTLAAMSGVAHGTVGWVIPELQEMGFVKDLSGKRGTRRLFDLRRLCDLWVNAYITTLRPRMLLGRFYAHSINGWESWPIATDRLRWGGEPAAARQTQYLKPGELTLYADSIPSAFVAKQKLLKDPGPGQAIAVDIRRSFWHFPEEPGMQDTVPPLLIYADLLAMGEDRCREAAAMIYEDHLVRLLTQT